MRNKWLLFLFLFFGSLHADDICCLSSCECCEGPCSGYFNVRHREPGGIGYSRGYTSADLFYLFKPSERWASFFDFRGHVFNDGKWASNAGLGLRFIPCSDDGVYGLNLYWDWREANHTNFHQMGAGLELLWPCWDIRANGYAPINRHKKIYRQGFNKFEGHTAFFFQKSELALWGADVNLGYWLLNYGCFKIHTGLGGYYFQGDYGENARGGLFRAKIHFLDLIVAEGQISYDNQFKWIGQGELSLRLSFGPSVKRYAKPVHSCCDLLAVEERLVEQPQRFEIVVSTTHKKKGRGRNPVTGELVNFFFVNNFSGSDGTIESPFATLAKAESASKMNDAIYIFPGDGSPYGVGLLTLKDYQLVGGAGAPLEMLTRFGRIDIPAQSTLKPRLGIGTFLANRNFISGLEIQTEVDTIVGSSIEAPVVRDNVIVSNVMAPISLSDTTGKFIVERNILQSNGSAAVLLFNVTGTVAFRNNEINAPNLSGNDAAIFGTAFNGTFLIENNVISSDMKGIHFFVDFKGEFQSKNNQILTIDEKILLN